MNKKIYAGLLTLLPILLALAGCTQESFRPTDADTTDGSTLMIKVNAPGEDPSLRAAMSQMEDSKDFLVRFEADDKVLLFASQDGKLFEIGDVPFATLSEDGKVGTLSVTLPAEIDQSKPIDLVGYNGINQTSYSKTPNMVFYDKDHFDESILSPELKGRALALMPASSYNGCRIESFDAPVVFRLKGIVPADTDMTKVEGDFEHIGAYEVVVLENRSDKPFRDPVTFSEPGTRTKKDYVYNGGYRSGVGTRYPFIDLMTGEVLELAQSNPFQSFISGSKALAPGETGLYMTWVMPRPDLTQIPELTLAAGSYSSTVTSEGLIPARKGPMKSGIAYIGYGYWDGEHIVALDREKEERKTQYVTVTTDIPAGSPITVSAYLDYSSRDAAYVDLNDNNVKDPGEAITKSFGAMEYTVSQPRISFRGAFLDLQLSKQQLTDVEISPVASLYDLDVRNNMLSAAVINKIIDQLPDRSGVKPDDVHHLLLQISGNPGLEEDVEINLQKALEKGWSVDVPIVRSDLPQNYMELSGEPPFTLAFSVEADPAERDKIWIDLNGNGTIDEGEKIETFGSTGANVVYPTANQLIIYGHITSLTVSYGQVKYYWGGSDNVNTEIKHLNFSGTGISACISALYPKLETLLLADNPMLLLINTEKLPFLSNPAGLKVLDLGNSGSIIRQMNIPYDVPPFGQMTGLTYLNIQGWDWTSEQVDLSKMTKLERLIASGNKLETIDLSGAKSLKYIELIGNQLTAETIDKLLSGLPDRTGKSPGQLFIADNPGSGSGKYSIARSKNWRVDARNSISNHPARRPNMEGEDW